MPCQAINQNLCSFKIIINHTYMFHTMKRGFSSEVVVDHNIALANCLMFLSQGRRISYDIPSIINNASSTAEEIISNGNYIPTRVFECKTCNRQFPSFQALGGHRASHKRPKSAEDGAAAEDESTSVLPAKAKTHECSICGLEFAIGQALGGHMRRHRSADQGAAAGNLNRSSDHHQIISLVDDHQAPIVKKSNTSSSIRKVFSFDLNLTPMENVDLHLGKPAPIKTTLDCYL